MLSERQEYLKDLIEVSKVLSDSEKQEWLQLLELMNDKQLSELEEILNPISYAKNTDSVSPSKNNFNSPLSHIANLPTGINFSDNTDFKILSQVSPKTTEAKPKPVRHNTWLDQMKLAMTEKELVSPKNNLVIQDHVEEEKPKPVIPKPVVKQNLSPEVNSSNFAVKEKIPSAASDFISNLTSKPVQQQPTTKDEGLTKKQERSSMESPEAMYWEPKSSADASMLTVSIFRSQGAEKLLSRLQSLVKKESYVKVLINLEKSALYKDYIITGMAFLNPSAQSPSLHAVLDIEEFSQIADIFRKIQVN